MKNKVPFTSFYCLYFVWQALFLLLAGCTSYDRNNPFDSNGTSYKPHTYPLIQNGPNLSDADNNVYTTVTIGSQTWTVENLRTTKYNDGTPIPVVTNETQWKNLATPAYCFLYRESEISRLKWGALYNWYAVNTGKLAPAGWHVPTDTDWATLENYLVSNGYNWDGSYSGNKIGKSLAAKTDWSSNLTIGAIGNDLSSNNSTGFSALPGGYLTANVVSAPGINWGVWWSSTASGQSNALCYSLYPQEEGLYWLEQGKEGGFSVRLVKNN